MTATPRSISRDVGIGVLGGVMSGLFGIGGGVIVVPIMVLGLKMAQKQAQATSLVMIALAATSGALTYAVGSDVAWELALIVIVGGLAGTLIGTKWVTRIEDARLQTAFAVLLVIAAIRIAWPTSGPQASNVPDLTTWIAVGLLASGLAMGLLSSMMGLGGGMILIPILIAFFGFSLHDAASTSLIVMIPIALLGAYRLTKPGLTQWSMGLRLGVGALVGAVIGAQIALHTSASVLRVAFALLLIYTAAQMAWISLRKKSVPSADAAT